MNRDNSLEFVLHKDFMVSFLPSGVLTVQLGNVIYSAHKGQSLRKTMFIFNKILHGTKFRRILELYDRFDGLYVYPPLCSLNRFSQ
jgi:hypothetical protein